jgi:polyhydroxyalkanoate synthase
MPAAPPSGGDPFARVAIGMWLHATQPRPDVGITPHTIVHAQDKLLLRYYAPTGKGQALPVVLVPSLINKAYIVDLEEGRSLVAALAAAGHGVYLVDWGTPGPEDAEEDVGYILLELLHRSIVRACRHAGTERALLLGYCLGGTLATMYTALRPQRVAGLVALNTPVKFAAGGRFRDLVDPAAFDVDTCVDPDGLVPVSIMKPAFQLLDPVGAVTKYQAVEQAAGDSEKFARVMARERWLEENVPVSGAFAREFIRSAYQEDRLLAGTWMIRGEAVRLGNIRCPVLVVSCARDFIAPPAACLPLAELVGAQDREVVSLDCGHIGVVVGAEGPRTFYPLLDRWFRRVGCAVPHNGYAVEQQR